MRGQGTAEERDLLNFLQQHRRRAKVGQDVGVQAQSQLWALAVALDARTGVIDRCYHELLRSWAKASVPEA
eukprot:6125155-Karenia_brevis.AAC.1